MYVNALDGETLWVEEDANLPYFFQEVEHERLVFTYLIIGQSNLKSKPR